MNNVLLQPAAGAEAAGHYESTIHNGISIDLITPYVDTKLLAEAKKTAVENKVLVWGMTPGDGIRNPATWEALSPGDLVLFSGKNCVRGAAIVKLKCRSATSRSHCGVMTKTARLGNSFTSSAISRSSTSSTLNSTE